MSRTMSKLAFLSLVGVMLIMSAVPASAELKIGYVRPEYLFANYEPYKEALKKLQDFEKEEMTELQQQGEEFQKKVEEASKQAVLMSDEMKLQTQQELATQKEALDKAYDDLYRDGGILAKKQQEYIDPIIKEINDVLMRVGENNEYDYILDAEQGILFADEQYDISEMVLEELNKGVSTE